MLKERRQLFTALFLAADLAVVSAAWILAYFVRFRTELVPVEKGIPDFSNYLLLLFVIWPVWASVFRRFGLYRPMRGVRPSSELGTVVQANACAVVIFIALVYFLREKTVPFSRLVFLSFALLATLLTALQRLGLRAVLSEMRRKGYNLRYLLIVGSGGVAEELALRVREHRELGLQILGCLSEEGRPGPGPGGVPVVGSYGDLASILGSTDIDQIVVALPLEHSDRIPMIMGQIGDSLVDVRIVPDLYRFVSIGGAIEEFEGLPVVTVQTSPMAGVGLVAKRSLDVAVAVPALVLLGPLCLLVALLVKCTSRGPVFFAQERVSLDGTRFTIYKFRTMRLDAEAHGPGWTTRGDSRVTPLGRFLRSTSLDELPQVLNVLKGDMSFVGPRPERPVFIDEFRRRVPRYMLRHKVPAGLTGWAQVNGWRGDTSIDKRIEYDLYYMENWSVWFDLRIMFLTVVRGFRNRNAY